MHVRPLHEFDLDHHTLLLVFFREDGEEAMYQDTDSDVAEQRDCGKVKVKWTQDEVSSCPLIHPPPMLIYKWLVIWNELVT